ncbi:MAG TPA: hypothetical protein VF846_17285, partial [Thermoanaerobaculia bacterium]
MEKGSVEVTFVVGCQLSVVCGVSAAAHCAPARVAALGPEWLVDEKPQTTDNRSPTTTGGAMQLILVVEDDDKI